MKRIQTFAIAAIVLAGSGAFITKSRTQDDFQANGWAIIYVDPDECRNYLLDNGTYCSASSYGPICTINGTAAYANETGCEYGFEFLLLRQP